MTYDGVLKDEFPMRKKKGNSVKGKGMNKVGDHGRDSLWFVWHRHEEWVEVTVHW